MKKEYIELSIIFSLVIAVLAFAFWQGMNKELCARNYDDETYQQMKLTCKKD